MQKDSSNYLDFVFSALANKHRREIIAMLAIQPVSISHLADIRKLSLPAIHKHIKLLEKARLISRRKIGRVTYLAMKRNALTTLQNWIVQYHAYWGNDNESLENYADYLQKTVPSPLKLRRKTKGGENK
jgi:DNA-binding transcriptional ArsR family regulator